MESRTRGSRPRPRTQKKPRTRPSTALPKTDPLEAKNKNTRGQGPRTQAQVFSKKKVFKFFIRRTPKQENKKIFANFLRGFWRFPTQFSKRTNFYYCRNRCKCTSHYMGILRYKPSRRGSASVLC